MYEVELKFPVADTATLEGRLAPLGPRWSAPSEQVDRYFAHPCRDFAATDEALRLRWEGGAAAITWKGPKIDPRTKTRREIEIPLTAPAPEDGPAAIDHWTSLLEALGFRAVHEVVKRRRAATVEWRGATIEVALDRVAGLGEFVELEARAAGEDLAAARDRVESLARALGCADAERRSYLELLLAAR